MAKPEIRLKGFKGEWEEKSFSQIVNVNSGMDYKGLNAGSIPVYGTGGYMLSVDKSLSDEDAIGIGRKGTIDSPQLLKAPFWTIDTLFFMTLKKGYDLNFVYSLCQTVRWKDYDESTGVPSLSKNNIDRIETYVPNINEQKSIADYFKSLDSMIQGVTKKIASLKQMKQACLVSMFPQAGETTPRVRFKRFEGEWVKVAMGDVFTERHEISTITNDLPQLSFTIEEGVIRPEDRKTNKRDFLIKDKTNKKYLVTYVDDIIYNPANVIYGAIHKNSLCNGVVSPIYKIFYTEQDATFMECVVRKPEFIQGMTVYMEGTVQKLKTLKPEAFLQMIAYIAPTKDEQRHIGRFFRSMDSQISLQEQRLEKLKQIKSACLDKMFV